MPYNPDIHHRRSIRLKEYDYTQIGAYFVTICTHQRQCLFGEIIDGEMHPNLSGQVVISRWRNIPHHFSSIKLDEFIVMPNHLHGIIIISDGLRNQKGKALPLRGTDNGSLGAIVQNFKSISTRKINQINRSSGTPVWQRNYYEQIIHDEIALDNIKKYIITNPSHWKSDRENPVNLLL
jgi:REP element-mobilizing transposase RayT